MTRAMKELKEVAIAEVPKRIQDLRKECAKLQAQVATGTPPKNTMQLKNIRKTIARLLTKVASEQKQNIVFKATAVQKPNQMVKSNQMVLSPTQRRELSSKQSTQQKGVTKKNILKEVNPKA